MSVFEKEKKRLSPFSFFKAKTKERKKAVNRQQTPLRAAKVFYYNEWLQEIEDHECKWDTSEKQLVKMSSLKPFKNSVGRSRRSMFATCRCPPLPNC